MIDLILAKTSRKRPQKCPCHATRLIARNEEALAASDYCDVLQKQGLNTLYELELGNANLPYDSTTDTDASIRVYLLMLAGGRWQPRSVAVSCVLFGWLSTLLHSLRPAITPCLCMPDNAFFFLVSCMACRYELVGACIGVYYSRTTRCFVPMQIFDFCIYDFCISLSLIRDQNTT